MSPMMILFMVFQKCLVINKHNKKQTRNSQSLKKQNERFIRGAHNQQFCKDDLTTIYSNQLKMATVEAIWKLQRELLVPVVNRQRPSRQP